MTEICEEMLSGEIKIEPCKSQKITYCTYCDYSSICQFDTSIKDNKYKVVLKKDKDTLWNEMKEKIDFDEEVKVEKQENTNNQDKQGEVE